MSDRKRKIEVRVSDEEKQIIARAAKLKGLTPSEYVRKLALSGATSALAVAERRAEAQQLASSRLKDEYYRRWFAEGDGDATLSA
jgi:uncharacterized protein (DUF1778 family)